MLGAILGVFVLTVAIGLYYVQSLIVKDTESELTILVDQKTNELNLHFNGIERAVGSVGDYILANLDKERLKTDKGYEYVFMHEVAIRAEDASRVAGNVVASYFRPNPLTYGRKAGVFLTSDGKGNYVSEEPTDIFLYAPDDRAHVGWYYEPMKAGHAIWMEPYMNQNLYIYMISYVIPLYIDGELIGIVGMDINMTDISRVTDDVHYENGAGFLISEGGNITYHKEFPEGLEKRLFNEEIQSFSQYLDPATATDGVLHQNKWHGEKRYFITGSLENGMLLGVSVPESDVTGIRTRMLMQMLLILLFVILVAVYVAKRTMIHVVEPIRELTGAAEKIARGELHTSIEYSSNDEIGRLADSVRSMSDALREYISYIHEQAYADAMTGVRNKTSYMDEVNLMERKIQAEIADFTVFLFDINGLKKINDNYGHEYGDMFIVDTANTLKKAFAPERVYRIGGDEFIVVEENLTEEDARERIASFEKALSDFNRENDTFEEELAVSKGVAIYRPGDDENYRAVFQRADENMYRDKEQYYRTHDRRKR